MENKSYNSPPITEAVIGINFTAPLSDKELTSFSKKLKKLYPELQVITNYNLSVGITDNHVNADTQLQKEESYRLSRDNLTQIIILSKHSFLLSQLAPYKGWDSLFSRFVECWSIKDSSIGFRDISRIGVRYINRIDIPVADGDIEFETYLNIYPYVPKSIGSLNAYAIQVSLPLDRIKCNAKINSAVVNSPIINNISFIIDSDISRDHEAPQSDNDIFNLLNEIRIEKNRIFEELITDNARKLFNHD